MEPRDFIEDKSLNYANEIIELNSIINVDLYDFRKLNIKSNKKIIINKYDRSSFLDNNFSLRNDIKKAIIFISVHKGIEFFEINEILEKVIRVTNKNKKLIYGLAIKSKSEYIYICY